MGEGERERESEGGIQEKSDVVRDIGKRRGEERRG